MREAGGTADIKSNNPLPTGGGSITHNLIIAIVCWLETKRMMVIKGEQPSNQHLKNTS